MEALLHVNHLEKNLDEFVLKDVNLTLQPGYIMGLIGVNGTGKTTLIQTILNLYKKDAGDVYVNGYSMEEQEREAKDQIGFVLGKNVFEESLSVWKNAKLFGKLYSRFDEAVFRDEEKTSRCNHAVSCGRLLRNIFNRCRHGFGNIGHNAHKTCQRPGTAHRTCRVSPPCARHISAKTGARGKARCNLRAT